MPTAFLPTEDQGYLIVAAQLPDGASKERTDAVLQKIQGIASKIPGVEHVVTVSGISILDNRASLANAGVAFVVLKDWDVRLKEPGQDARSIALRLNGALQGVPEAFAFALPPPPIQGIGNVGGFTMQVELKNGNFDYALLQSLTNALVANGNAQSSLSKARHDLPGGRAAVLREGRPDQGRADRRHGRPGVLRPFGLCRSGLCRAVQQIRTRLPDLHAGAAGLPRDSRRHPQPQSQGGRRNHDEDRHGGRRHRSAGPAADQPLQSLSVVNRRRQPGGRLQLGPGARHHGPDRQAPCRPERATNGLPCRSRRSKSATRSTMSSALRC